MGTDKMGAYRSPESDYEDRHLEIKIRDLAKILSNDPRLLKNCFKLAGFLGIRKEDDPYIKRNGKEDQREIVQTTLEYWHSINGDKATVKKLSDDLSKQRYAAIGNQLKLYLGYTVVPDNEVKLFDLHQDCDDQKDMSNDLDEEILAKLNYMDMDDVDTDGYGAKDSIMIDGLDDRFNQDMDNKKVQSMLDIHSCPLQVVRSCRVQGRDKNIRSLKVKMKAKGSKPKGNIKLLMNEALMTLQKSQVLENFQLTVTKFDASSKKKKPTFTFPNLLILGGNLTKMACDYIAHKWS